MLPILATSMLAVFLIQVRAELAPVIVFVESVDSNRNEKDIFYEGEDVYCIIQTTGTGSIAVRIYITYNDAWKDRRNPPH